MKRLRRLGSLLLLPLAVQIMLAARAVACVDGTKPAASATKTASDMPGMDMSGTRPSHGGSSRDSNRTPCDRPFGPTSCQPLAACAGGALAAPRCRLAPEVVASPTMTALVVLAPTSQTPAPEPPPPRA